MNQFTYRFLQKCKKHTLTKVLIMTVDKSVKESLHWVDGRFKYSVFGTNPKGGYGKDGWPAIWRAVEEYGIIGGAGNSNQHQITIDAQNKLEPGVYFLRLGKWYKKGN